MEPDFSKLTFEEQREIVNQRKEKYEQNSRVRDAQDLTNKVEISVKTTMIGALADFEEFFADLWVDEDKEIKISASELKERYAKARESILDRGQGAIEKAKYHVNRFTVTRKQSHKYVTKFRRNS